MIGLITLSDAAKHAGVSTKTLQRAVARQELPVLGGCGELLVDPQEVDRWLYPDEPPGAPFEDEYKALLRGDPCCYCGDSTHHVDHIEAQSTGGSNAWTNFTGACRRCNGKKRALPLLTFLLGQTGASTEPLPLCAKCGGTVGTEISPQCSAEVRRNPATSDPRDPGFVRTAEQAAYAGDRTVAFAWLLGCLDHAVQLLDQVGSNVDARVVEAHRAELARGREWPGDPIASPDRVEYELDGLRSVDVPQERL